MSAFISAIATSFSSIFSSFKQAKPRKLFTNFAQGMSMGLAEIIPGVSSSTIAVLYGIYDDYIKVLHDASEVAKIGILALVGKKKWSDFESAVSDLNWPFAVLLASGMVGAIIIFSSLIEAALLQAPSYLFAFLFGLIPPTIYIVHDQIEESTRAGEVIMGVTVLVLLLVFYSFQGALQIPNPHPFYAMIAGTIAISAMVLPGISGSFMFLLLGIYNPIISAVSRVTSLQAEAGDFILLGAVLVGVLIGFVTSVRILRWAFENHRDTVLFFILGLLIASWYVLWPFVVVEGFSHGEPLLQKVAPWHLPLLQSLSLTLIILGTSIGVYAAHHWADRHDPESQELDHGMDKL